MTTEQKLNKKLAEWQGDFDIHFNKHLNCWRWQDPNGAWDIDFTDPEWGIAYCFKWLVPVTRNKLGNEACYDLMMRWIRDVVFGKEPALTLCLAIEKLIDSEAPSATSG